MDLSVYTPACLAQSTDRYRFDNKQAIAAGWGDLWNHGPSPTKPYAPREVQLPVISEAVCQRIDKYGMVAKSDICTQLDWKGVCQVCSVSTRKLAPLAKVIP